jgi:predicted RNA-binding Zn-ribbon protein involved in translation (DUF1610 family)
MTTDKKKKHVRKPCRKCGELTALSDLDLCTGELVYECSKCLFESSDDPRKDWP